MRRVFLNGTMLFLMILSQVFLSCDNNSPAGPEPKKYSISGSVVDSAGNSLEGITVSLSGSDKFVSAVSDSSGVFSFEGIERGSYTIIPGNAAHTFDPAELTVSLESSDMTVETIVVTQENAYEGIVFVTVPGGTFLMGDVEDAGVERAVPVHSVTISSFEMSVCEITQGQYESLTGTNPATEARGGNLPVVEVSWFDAAQFCNVLSDVMGYDRCYEGKYWRCDYNKNGFRLPTEAEWEYASRGGRQYEFGTDDGTLNENNAYYGLFALFITEVGTYPPNPFGLYNLAGNVAEWCSDSPRDYTDVSVIDPVGKAPSSHPEPHTYFKVERGGQRGGYPEWCRSSVRLSSFPEKAKYATGIRLVRRP